MKATKEPLDEGERGEQKTRLKTQHAENKDHGTWPHHFTAKRKSGAVTDSISIIVQSLSPIQLFVTPRTAACQASLSFTISQTYVHGVNDLIQPSHSLSPLSPPALNLSQHFQ